MLKSELVVAEALAKAHPVIKRLGKGEDSASLLLNSSSTLSEDSTWITGQIIGVEWMAVSSPFIS